VFDANMNMIGPRSANAAGQDRTLEIAGLTIGASYSIRVQAATRTAFSTGSYLLRVVTNPFAPESVTLGGAAPVDDAGTNESFLTATRLASQPERVADYRVFGQLRTGDRDVYTVRAPNPGFNRANVLTATIRGFATGLAPKIVVTNSLGLEVASTITADGNGLYTVRVSNAVGGADYNLIIGR